MAYIIAVCNHKGGVAKTSTVSALGTAFAAKGYKTLLVDFDTQANLTYSFVDMEKNPPKRYVFDAIRERKDIPQFVLKENLYLVPSKLDMTLVETEMYSMKRREYVLRDLLLPITDEYDFIIIDCPPALNILTVNALATTLRVTVPTTLDQLSYYGLKMLKAFVESSVDLNPNLKLNDIFFTMYQSNLNVTKLWEPIIRDEFGEIVMNTVISRNVKVSEAVSERCSIIDYSPESMGAVNYMRLADELDDRISTDLHIKTDLSV